MQFVSYLQKAVNRESLGSEEAQQAMDLILRAEATTAQIAGFLVALRMKGETVDELVGFARAMREHSLRSTVDIGGEPLLDTCGTGGDGAGTFNISTVAAFVIAGTGVRVAKHGNRSLSSHCGSADVLEALGVRINFPPERSAKAIRDIGIGFFFAPAYHPAMKHAQAARSEIRMRTAFNLLGPLTNPASATVQLVGAPSVRVAEQLAQALAALGLRRGLVVHGLDGLDEVTSTGDTLVLQVCKGVISDITVSPADFGVEVADRHDLTAANKEENRAIALEVLNGAEGPKRDIVVMNAAAGLVAAAKAESFREGAALAAQSIDSGAALKKLQLLAEFSHQDEVFET